MGCPSFQEGLIIIFVLVLILGATRLPQLGDALGRSIRAFKGGLKNEEIDVTPKNKLPPGADEEE